MPQFFENTVADGENQTQSETTQSSLRELSSLIAVHSDVVSQYLAANDLPQPSKSADGPSSVLPASAPKNIQVARQQLIAAALELVQIAAGPSELLPNLATGVSNLPTPDGRGVVLNIDADC